MASWRLAMAVFGIICLYDGVGGTITFTSPGTNGDLTTMLSESLPANTALFTVTPVGATGAVTYAAVIGTTPVPTTDLTTTGGVVTLISTTFLNYETQTTLTVLITATDSATTPVIGTATVTINIINEPAFLPEYPVCVATGATEGTVVTTFTPISTSTTTRTYAFATTGQDANSTDFSIAASTGQITVATGKTLDAKQDGTYSLIIEVTEGTEVGLGHLTVGVGCGSSSSAVVAGTLLTLLVAMFARFV